MIRSAASKVMWVGRATVFLMGLAVMLALVFGVASTAFGANGSKFILGSLNNTATAITKLTGTVDGRPALRVSNPSGATGSTALELQVANSQAPMKVNALAGTATNLSADELDGLDSTSIGRELWAAVNADGSLAGGRGKANSEKFGIAAGDYRVTFAAGTDLSDCAYTATTTNGLAGQTSVAYNSQLNAVEVFTFTSAGTPSDIPFHLIVAC